MRLSQSERAPQRAFTLIELLVVIAIIAVLAAILFPVFAQAREKARQTVCLSNMKQIALGIYMYAQDYDETLPTTADDGRLSWIDQIVPYVKNDQIRRCPSDSGFALHPEHKSSYGVNNYFGLGMSLAAISTPSDTIYAAELVGENEDDHFHPMYWGNVPDNDWAWRNGKPTEVAYARHNGGANYAFLDNHAKWLRFEMTYNPPAVNAYVPNP
ncbi:MAG TPA: DUF1559 domain-containing protein [Chthonomonadaceae bacterium]|nr:DUF1559 domain-containing protein [Chthonomonadaceae bacterium]